MPSLTYSDTKNIVEKIEELSDKDIIINLQNYLHQTGRKEGGETVFECPFCNDKSKNNLLANSYKKTVWCFASGGDHAKQILLDIYTDLTKDKPNYKTTNNDKKRPKTTEPNETFLKSTQDIKLSENPEINTMLREKLVLYIDECNRELLNDEKVLKYLYKKRGITKETVTFTGMGIDRKRHKWTLPKYTYQTNKNNIIDDVPLINCELRGSNLDKKEIQVLTKKDFLPELAENENASLPTALCQINCYIEGVTDTLFITEGFFDGYIAKQRFKENYHIVTSSNGIGTLAEQIGYVDFEKYNDIILCVDNDEKSEPKAQKVYEKLLRYKAKDNVYMQKINCTECTIKDNCYKHKKCKECTKTEDEKKTECKKCEYKPCKDLNDKYLMKIKYNQTTQNVF